MVAKDGFGPDDTKALAAIIPDNAVFMCGHSKPR